MLAATQPLGALGIVRPTLLLDAARVRRNIERMAAKAARAGVRFRPHFKTHQSAGIGEWFRDAGVRCITVSSVDMAEYFARHGWRDITIAFPVNPLQMAKIDALAREVELHLVADSPAVVDALDRGLGQPVHLWIKVDTGARRAGIAWTETARILALARRIGASRQAGFAGLLTHAGHSYDARSRDAILAVHAESLQRLARIRRELETSGAGPCAVSIGDTPCCSLADSFAGADEIRPGNFVFYDLMQADLGTCTPADVALAVACPVVGVHPERRQIVLYGGAVHLSKDWMHDAAGRRIHGRLATWAGGTWGAPAPGAAVVSVSQEHGVVEFDAEIDAELRIGDLVTVLPVHSCLASDLYGEYWTLQGERIPRTQSNRTVGI
jgi:D-serine deaminase-like pyridoxal phosphate-dependent protein